jgi:hypothetical protein
MGKDRRQLLSLHLDLHLEVFVPKKKKEIVAAAAGWGVIEYLRLDWMNDGTYGWMEKISLSRRPLLYVILTLSNLYYG